MSQKRSHGEAEEEAFCPDYSPSTPGGSSHQSTPVKRRKSIVRLQQAKESWQITDEGLYKCIVPKCPPQILTNRFALRRHWAEMHKTNNTIYQCPKAFCKATFATLHDSRRHVTTIHGVRRDAVGKERFPEEIQRNENYISPKGMTSPSRLALASKSPGLAYKCRQKWATLKQGGKKEASGQKRKQPKQEQGAKRAMNEPSPSLAATPEATPDRRSVVVYYGLDTEEVIPEGLRIRAGANGKEKKSTSPPVKKPSAEGTDPKEDQLPTQLEPPGSPTDSADCSRPEVLEISAPENMPTPTDDLRQTPVQKPAGENIPVLPKMATPVQTDKEKTAETPSPFPALKPMSVSPRNLPRGDMRAAQEQYLAAKQRRAVVEREEREALGRLREIEYSTWKRRYTKAIEELEAERQRKRDVEEDLMKARSNLMEVAAKLDASLTEIEELKKKVDNQGMDKNLKKFMKAWTLMSNLED